MKTSGAALKKAQQRYKANFDERVRPTKHVYKSGDLVFVRRESNSSGMPDHKLRTEVTDPVPIKKVNTASRYVVVTLPDGTDSTVSYDRLSPVTPRMVPDNSTKDLVSHPEPHTSLNDDIKINQNIPSLIPSAKPTSSRRRRSPRLNPPIPDVNALERESHEPPLYKRRRIVSFDAPRQRYRVRWYGYPTVFDTYEYAQFLPRTLVCEFRRRRLLPPLANSLWQ